VCSRDAQGQQHVAQTAGMDSLASGGVVPFAQTGHRSRLANFVLQDIEFAVHEVISRHLFNMDVPCRIVITTGEPHQTLKSSGASGAPAKNSAFD
jgi:hypothetical protein